MPPPIALLLTLGFIAYLLRWETRQQGQPVGVLWLPITWIFFVASRFPTQWLQIMGLPVGGVGGGTTSADGSPIDAVFFLTLILLGAKVLVQRQLDLGLIVRSNLFLALFFAYGFLAISWSDFPFVAFKRWIKVLGHPIMALIIVTQTDVVGALTRVLRRAGFMLLPLSVLFIKYYPEYGRGFDAWTGTPFNRGVSLNKNELGYNCLIFGLFFVWNYLVVRKTPKSKRRREELLVDLGFVGMISWLLFMADSATSLACLMVGVGTMLALSFPFVSKRYFGTTVLVGIGLAVLIETTFGVYAAVVELLGRDPTLTDRTEVWGDVLAFPINPLLGAGFESFWLGERLEVLWAKWHWQPNQAHSGYIETYINLGAIGLFVLGGWIINTFRSAQQEALRNFDYGRFRMAFLFVMLFYNYTEAAFKALHFMWTMFHIISFNYMPGDRRNEETRPIFEARINPQPDGLSQPGAHSHPSCS